MEPEENNHKNMKTPESPLTHQINKYRHALPEVPRHEGHFFFKQVTRQIQEISYVTIGYRVGTIPFELQDLMAVIINNIHYTCELNLKIIVDGDQFWVTASIGIPSQQINTLRYRIEQSHLNESLLKTQHILSQFLDEIYHTAKREDTVILQKLNKSIIKQIENVYKNPDLDD